jgi:arylformamidase
MRIYDVTVPISANMIVYPGDPAVLIEPVQEIGKDNSLSNVSLYSLGSHTGTHVDPPFHFIKDGPTVDRLPLDLLIGPVRVAEVSEEVIDETVVDRLDLDGVTRLFFKTRNSRLWERPDFVDDFVYITPNAASTLIELGVRAVGIDYLSVEKFDFETPMTHLTFLRAGVLIVEGLDLRAVEPGDYEMICLPMRIKGGDGAPARVVLRG